MKTRFITAQCLSGKKHVPLVSLQNENAISRSQHAIDAPGYVSLVNTHLRLRESVLSRV